SIPARRCDWKQARIPPRARGTSRRPQFKRLVHYPRGGNSSCRQKGNLIVANHSHNGFWWRLHRSRKAAYLIKLFLGAPLLSSVDGVAGHGRLRLGFLPQFWSSNQTTDLQYLLDWSTAFLNRVSPRHQSM